MKVHFNIWIFSGAHSKLYEISHVKHILASTFKTLDVQEDTQKVAVCHWKPGMVSGSRWQVILLKSDDLVFAGLSFGLLVPYVIREHWWCHGRHRKWTMSSADWNINLVYVWSEMWFSWFMMLVISMLVLFWWATQNLKALQSSTHLAAWEIWFWY